MKEGPLERLADRPGAKRKAVALEDYERLKWELEDKERALSGLAVELSIFKKVTGVSWER